MSRLSRLAVNMEVAKLMSERGTCERGKVGAVVTMDGRIVATGYVGSPAGTPHCLDEGCIIGPEGGCIRTVHAEASLISYAAKKGIKLEGGHMFVTLSPCLSCAKLIVNSGITEVIYLQPYRDTSGVDFLKSAGVSVLSYSEVFPDGNEGQD